MPIEAVFSAIVYQFSFNELMHVALKTLQKYTTNPSPYLDLHLTPDLKSVPTNAGEQWSCTWADMDMLGHPMGFHTRRGVDRVTEETESRHH